MVLTNTKNNDQKIEIPSMFFEVLKKVHFEYLYSDLHKFVYLNIKILLYGSFELTYAFWYD